MKIAFKYSGANSSRTYGVIKLRRQSGSFSDIGGPNDRSHEIHQTILNGGDPLQSISSSNRASAGPLEETTGDGPAVEAVALEAGSGGDGEDL
jgi:hypothetical protein